MKISLSILFFISQFFVQLLFAEEFPAVLAKKVWEKAIIAGGYYPYEREIREDSTDKVPLIWKDSDTDLTGVFQKLDLHFEARLEKERTRKKFTVSISYEGGSIVVLHSDPAERKHLYGLRTIYASRGQVWGGYIFGNEVPGVLYFVARTVQEKTPPIAICPRFAKRKGAAFELLGRNPQLKIDSVAAELKAEFQADFITGYGAGSAVIHIEERGIIPPVVSEAFFVGDDLKANISYRPSKFMKTVPMIFPTEQDVQSVGVSADFKLVNSAGRVKKVRRSHLMWIQKIENPNVQKFTALRPGEDLKRVDILDGACVFVLPTQQSESRYDGA